MRETIYHHASFTAKEFQDYEDRLAKNRADLRAQPFVQPVSCNSTVTSAETPATFSQAQDHTHQDRGSEEKLPQNLLGLKSSGTTGTVFLNKLD